MKSEALCAIIESNVDDLRILAQIAGGHPTSFYRGANFDDADLRGQDLRGFNLQASTFRRTRVDRHTKVDPQYIKDVGLERKFKVEFNMSDSLLKSFGITLENPIAEHLGDILEDALFRHKQTTKFIPNTLLITTLKVISHSLKNFNEPPLMTALISRHTGEKIKLHAKRNMQKVPDFCTILMTSYMSQLIRSTQ